MPSLPIAEAVGRDSEETAQLYRSEGYQVEIVDLDVNVLAEVTHDLRPDRIRLYVRGGRVDRATRG